MGKLSDFVEQISDDFQSTFVVIDDNTFSNLMGLPGDFLKLEGIIHKYIPNCVVRFTKTNKLGEDATYDFYIIEALPKYTEKGVDAFIEENSELMESLALGPESDR